MLHGENSIIATKNYNTSFVAIKIFNFVFVFAWLPFPLKPTPSVLNYKSL